MIISSSLLVQFISGTFLIPIRCVEESMPILGPPVPRNWEQWVRRSDFDQIVLECWQAGDGYSDDNIAIETGMDQTKEMMESFYENPTLPMDPSVYFRPSTYGEITKTGSRQLFHYMQLPSSTEKHDKIVFMDWGSGVGKLVMQASIEVPCLQKSVGIECSKHRHVAAVDAKARALTIMQSRKVDNLKRIDFEEKVKLVEGDIFAQDLDGKSLYNDATHIYLSSLCFTPEMMYRLEDVFFAQASQTIVNERKKYHKPFPNLKCIATLRMFPTYSAIVRPQVHYLEMSWTRPRGLPVYFYFLNTTS